MVRADICIFLIFALNWTLNNRLSCNKFSARCIPFFFLLLNSLFIIINIATFLHEDRKRSMYSDAGNEVAIVKMDVDNEIYPLESITNYKKYVDLKLLKKPVKQEWKLILMKSLQWEKKCTTSLSPIYRCIKKDVFTFWYMN